MKRIVNHWPAGTHTPSAYERSRYHFLVAGTGEVVEGDKPPEANRSPLGPDYVRHAGQFNSDSIGVAICGMQGAVESPFDPGLYPITPASVWAAIGLNADLCQTYNIKVTRNTVVLHSEVLPRFGRGVYKWDINWLPWMTEPGDPVEVGDWFRAEVRKELKRRARPPLWARLRGWWFS